MKLKEVKLINMKYEVKEIQSEYSEVYVIECSNMDIEDGLFKFYSDKYSCTLIAAFPTHCFQIKLIK